MTHRHRILSHLSVVAAIMALAACGASGTPAPTSGVHGTTVVDGGCPLAQHGTPCPDRPLRAHITITAVGSTASVASADTDAQGRFSITLRPGTYVLHAANLTGAALPLARSYRVTVVTGTFATVEVRFDSGIR